MNCSKSLQGFHLYWFVIHGLHSTFHKPFRNSIYEIDAGQTSVIKIVFRQALSISSEWTSSMSTHINISLKQLTWHLTGDGWGPPPFLGNIWWDIGLENMFQCLTYTGTVSRWAVSYQARCHYRYCHINLNENLNLIQHSVNTGESIMGQTRDSLGIITCLVIRDRPICQSSVQILI